jgi:hypothetical protein
MLTLRNLDGIMKINELKSIAFAYSSDLHDVPEIETGVKYFQLLQLKNAFNKASDPI